MAVPSVGVYTNIKKETVSLRSAQNTQISEQTGWDSERLSSDRRSTVYLITQVFFWALGGTSSKKVMHSITKEAVDWS